MYRRSPKRYTVRRAHGGYEVRDADESGECVYFSASRRIAREMSKQLNQGLFEGELPPSRRGLTPS